MRMPGGRPVWVTHLKRYREIIAVLVKYGFVDVVQALRLTPYLAAGRRVLSAVGREVSPDLARPQRLRLTCEELGPTFIKFGPSLGPRVFGYPSLGLAGFVVAGVLGMGLAVGILRSGRL